MNLFPALINRDPRDWFGLHGRSLAPERFSALTTKGSSALRPFCSVPFPFPGPRPPSVRIIAARFHLRGRLLLTRTRPPFAGPQPFSHTPGHAGIRNDAAARAGR